ATAQSFLTWLSGGEGIESIRSLSPNLNSVRERPDSDRTSGREATRYQVWAQEQQDRTITRPTTQLLHGGRYLKSLDGALRNCLESESDAQACLDRVAEEWNSISDELGIEKQQRAWRRTTGRRA
ncbi:MAG: hypothetical protein AAF989_03740, partial [Planctomycetota bacterium]